MIGKDQIAAAARAADEQAEQGIEEWALEVGVDLDGATYVSAQRALRAAMVLDGLNPMEYMDGEEVTLSMDTARLRPILGSVWMDGFAAGLNVANKPCEAVIWHGPGHQSATKCDRTGEHTIHGAGASLEWTGDEAHTDFFDQSPEVD